MDPKEHEIQGGGGGHHHACQRCGWVYPNPHPSAKQRRAHKKHCVNTDGITIAENMASDDGDGSDGLVKLAVEVFMDSKAGLEESMAGESKTNNADDINKQIDRSPGDEIKIQGSSESSTDQLKDTVSVQDCDLVCVTNSVDSYVLDNRSNSLDEGLIEHTDILSHSVIGESPTSCTAGIEFPLDASIRRSITESGFTNVSVRNMDAEVSNESDLVINSDALTMSSAETSTGVISNLEDMGEIFRKKVSSDPTNKDVVDASLDPNGIDCVTYTSQEVRIDAFIDSVQILGGSIHIDPSPETKAGNTNALTNSLSSEASTEIGPTVREDDGSNVPEVSVSHAGGVETKFDLDGHLANQVPSKDQSSFVDIDSDKAANFPPSTKHIEQENCNLAETRSKSTPQKVVVDQALTDENEKGAPLIVCSDADKVAISAVKINLNEDIWSNQPEAYSDTTIGEPLSTKTAIFDSSMQLGGTDSIKCSLEDNSELDGMKSTIKEVIANQTAIDEENMKGTDVEKNDLSVVKTDLIEYIASDQPEAQLESKTGEPLSAQEALSADDKSEYISREQEASHLLPHEDIQETFPSIPSIGLVTSDVDSQSHEAAELDGVNFVDERIGQCLEGVTQVIYSSNPKAEPATSSSNEDQETTTMDSGSCNNVQAGTQNEAANVDAQSSREGPMVGSCQPNTINSSQPTYCCTDNLDDGSCNAVLDGNITHHIDSTDSLKMGISIVENNQLEELNTSAPEIDISMGNIQLHEDIEMYKLEKSGEMSKTPSSVITVKGIEIDGVSGEKMSKCCSDQSSNHDVTSQEILVEEAIGVKDASVIKADSKVEQIENENRIAGNNREEHILLEEHIIPAVNVGSLIQSSVTHIETGNQDVAKGCDSSVSSLPPVEDHGCSERHPNDPVAAQDAASDTVNLIDGVEGHEGSISDGVLPSTGDATDTHSIAIPEAQSTSEDIAAPTEEAFLFEAPSFMTLVEPNRGCDIHSKETSQNLTNDSQAPTEKKIKDKKKDVEIVPTLSNTSEKSHTPLKSLLLEANVECKQKPSNAKDRMHKNQAVSSPVKSDANSVGSGARRAENDWNSPARLPKIKTVEKKKVKGKEGWVPFMCCSYLKS